LALSKALAHPLGPMGVHVVLGRETGRSLEHAVEVAGAELDRLGQLGERRRFFALLDETASLGDQGGVLRLERRAVRITPLARPETGCLRGCQIVVKRHILRVRGSRRA
jgi:hypothetical protein